MKTSEKPFDPITAIATTSTSGVRALVRRCDIAELKEMESGGQRYLRMTTDVGGVKSVYAITETMDHMLGLLQGNVCQDVRADHIKMETSWPVAARLGADLQDRFVAAQDQRRKEFDDQMETFRQKISAFEMEIEETYDRRERRGIIGNIFAMMTGQDVAEDKRLTMITLDMSKLFIQQQATRKIFYGQYIEDHASYRRDLKALSSPNFASERAERMCDERIQRSADDLKVPFAVTTDEVTGLRTLSVQKEPLPAADAESSWGSRSFKRALHPGIDEGEDLGYGIGRQWEQGPKRGGPGHSF